MVLEGPKACLGYSSALQTIGGRFTRDIQGRPLTMFSKESRYSTMACVGVSKYYPMFKGKSGPIFYFRITVGAHAALLLNCYCLFRPIGLVLEIIYDG